MRVELARGLDVAVETHTSLGSVRNRYPTRSSASSRLVLTTEMGSVRVDECSTPRRDRPVEAQRPDRPTAPTARPSREDPELDRILKMVEAGSLSAHDADELLRAMGRV